MFDVENIRSDYPILKNGYIYLDNAASSLTPEQVVLKVLEYYREYRANVERGVHRYSQRASEEYERSHKDIASFINAPGPENVVMVRNTTEAINVVANTLDWKKGDKIVTSIIEHHSNYITWLRVAQRYGCKVQVVRSNNEGMIDLAEFDKAIDESTRLVAMTHVSNVLGCIQPIKEIASIAHEHGALMLSDSAQGVPHIATDVREMNVDFLAFSGHKMLGPTGSGGLYISNEQLYNIEPLNIGGGTISDVSLNTFTLAFPPQRFEAGTPAIAQVIGLGEACRYLKRVGMDAIKRQDEILAIKLVNGLNEIDGVEIYGPKDPNQRVGLVSFNIIDMNPHDVAITLDLEYDIAIRSGHHCALPLMKELFNLPDGNARASTYLYNTTYEIEKLLGAIEDLTH